MYWRISRFPELQHLSEEERRALLRERVGRGFTARLALSCVSRGLFLGLLIALAILIATATVSPTSPSYLVPLVVVFAWLSASLCLYQFFMIRIRGQLRGYFQEEQLKGRRSPVCLSCGYAVHQSQTACPECGRAVLADPIAGSAAR